MKERMIARIERLLAHDQYALRLELNHTARNNGTIDQRTYETICRSVLREICDSTDPLGDPEAAETFLALDEYYRFGLIKEAITRHGRREGLKRSVEDPSLN